MRRIFLALAWRPTDRASSGRADAVGTRLATETGWRRSTPLAGLALWMPPSQAYPVQPLCGGEAVIIGETSPMPGSAAIAAGAVEARTVHQVMHQFSRRYWGQYVALARPRDGDLLEIYRDPSGAIDLMTWDLGDGLWVVASDMARAPAWLRPRRQSLNWTRIGEMLATPSALTSTPLFDDVEVVAPGEMLTLGGRRPERTPIWSPEMFVQPGGATAADLEAELTRRLQACTAAILQRYDRVLVELSGGLDSSVLAGAISAAGETDRVAAWLNYQGDRADGDEAPYARAVTDRLGAELTVVRKVAAPLDGDHLAELAAEFWPAMAGVDIARDRHEAELVRTTGATAIVSGQGGDGVYFQYPTAMVAADAVHRDGLKALGSPLLADVARRTRGSVWHVLREVRRAARKAETRPTISSEILNRDLRHAARDIVHPWVRVARASGVTPGKALHIQGLAVTHIYNGRSRRRRLADLVYPHFAQPVTELCLGIPVPDLAGASYDRPFARRAFADLLPPEIVARRSKGNLTSYFGRMVASSAEFLQPYLLEGCLCEAGLFDRKRLEASLDPVQLVFGGAPGDVLWAAVTEAWVRYWQTQVADSPTALRNI